jgi:hypothetical protein
MARNKRPVKPIDGEITIRPDGQVVARRDEESKTVTFSRFVQALNGQWRARLRAKLEKVNLDPSERIVNDILTNVQSNLLRYWRHKDEVLTSVDDSVLALDLKMQVARVVSGITEQLQAKYLKQAKGLVSATINENTLKDRLAEQVFSKIFNNLDFDYDRSTEEYEVWTCDAGLGYQLVVIQDNPASHTVGFSREFARRYGGRGHRSKLTYFLGFPYVIFVALIQNDALISELYCFGSPNKIEPDSDYMEPLYYIGLPNTFGDHSVCMGNTEAFADKSQGIIPMIRSMYWNGEFNTAVVDYAVQWMNRVPGCETLLAWEQNSRAGQLDLSEEALEGMKSDRSLEHVIRKLVNDDVMTTVMTLMNVLNQVEESLCQRMRQQFSQNERAAPINIDEVVSQMFHQNMSLMYGHLAQAIKERVTKNLKPVLIAAIREIVTRPLQTVLKSLDHQDFGLRVDARGVLQRLLRVRRSRSLTRQFESDMIHHSNRYGTNVYSNRSSYRW